MDFQQDLSLIAFLWKYIYGHVFASLTAEILTVDGGGKYLVNLHSKNSIFLQIKAT